MPHIPVENEHQHGVSSFGQLHTRMSIPFFWLKKKKIAAATFLFAQSRVPREKPRPPLSAPISCFRWTLSENDRDMCAEPRSGESTHATGYWRFQLKHSHSNQCPLRTATKTTFNICQKLGFSYVLLDMVGTVKEAEPCIFHQTESHNFARLVDSYLPSNLHDT